MAEWIGAVDGGGTKTAAALLSREGDLVTLPRAGGCNPQDNPAWEIELGNTVDALQSRGPEAEIVAMGMPGFGEVPALDLAVSAFVRARLGNTAVILNDVEMAFHGAFPDGKGLLLLAGTGSMAVFGSQAGILRAGGWGDVFGDEGSAYWIGRQGLSIASRELDGRLPATGFADRLCRALDLSPDREPLALMNWASGQPHSRSAIASLARHIDDFAQAGDERARDLFERAAGFLAEHHRAAVEKGGLAPDGPWATAGSVFRSPLILQAVSARIGHPPVSAALPPLGGGLLLAARQANWPVDQAFIDNLASRLQLASHAHNRT